jgi:hypothetical protein
MLRRTLKAVLRFCAPSEGLTRWIVSALLQSRGYLVAKAAEWAATQIEDQVRVVKGASVQRGPFAGMIIPVTDETSMREIAAHVLGSYERELYKLIHRQLAYPYELIVNVGAGWGFYCVGVARRCSGRQQVYAFEGDDTRRALCQRTAKLNGVWNRLDLRGMCNVEVLKNVVSEKERGLLLIDCEGCELDLLPADETSRFRNWNILVEVHDEHTTGDSTAQILCDRFRDSHNITFINIQHRDPTIYPELAGLSEFYASLLLDEGRIHSRGWLWLASQELVE